MSKTEPGFARLDGVFRLLGDDAGARMDRHCRAIVDLHSAEPGGFLQPPPSALRVIDVGQGSQRFMEALATASKGTAVPYLTVPQLDPFARRGTKSGDKS